MFRKKYDPEDPSTYGSRVFIRGRVVWLAWYPLRGLRSQARLGPRGNRFLNLAVGPLYLKLGPGVPTP